MGFDEPRRDGADCFGALRHKLPEDTARALNVFQPACAQNAYQLLR
jgi:hypothetical protein